MKINFGALKGRNIIYNVDSSTFKLVKPTTSITKSVLFNLMLHNSVLSDFDIKKSSVADFCCGTGLVGFEFLSLGAINCTFFDSLHQNLENIQANAKKFDIVDKVSTKPVDILNTKYAAKIVTGKYDIIFFDPPYGKIDEMLAAFLSLVKEKELLNKNGLIIIESYKAIDCIGFNKVLERKVRKDRWLSFFVL